MIRLYVIAPDKSSGEDFCRSLHQKGIHGEFHYHKISPRVIQDKISKSKQIIDDLNNVFKHFKDKTKSVVIACNTLQLWLDKVDKKYKSNVKIYTTFEACIWRFRSHKYKPVWLGTTPLVKKTESFPTLLSYNQRPAQYLVQELVWRIKMYYGDDIKTAPDQVKIDENNRKIQKQKINDIKIEILSILRKIKVKKVILGCTELPMIFKKEFENGIQFIDPADVLSEYIKSQSVSIVFAGGTISSLANKNGTRYGGKVFDLLEKLSENRPGAYKNINVTKSEIVYSGLSENITTKEHKLILNKVNEILDSGVTRIVVTHGTDSMEQSAHFVYHKLKNKLRKLNAIVVFTGSNYDVGSPQTDAWDNLRLSINGDVKYHKSGVFVAFHDKFIPANEVCKVYFDGISMHYASIKSRQYKKSVREYKKKVLNLNNQLASYTQVKPDNTGIMKYEVNVIRQNNKIFFDEVLLHKPRAIVFKLYHSGTANTTDKKSSIATVVSKLSKKGIVCFGATENGEPTDLHLYESSVELFKSGMVPLHNMYFEVALFKLSLLNIVKNKLSNSEIAKQMLTNYVGEIDVK
ncbi:MAG: asparaginase domain-containing protein [Candidatus Shapirobacteria bacterium]